jgi:hypothetical protein
VLVLGFVPVADALGHVSVGLLVGVALLSGVFGVFFDICNLAYIPSLVGRRGLVRAYSWLEVGNALASLLGPGLGGLLVQALGAARAVAADAVSFLASALCLGAIRRPTGAGLSDDAVAGEGGASAEPARTSALAELREGVRFVVREPVLRSLLIAQGVLVLGAHSIEAPIILLVYNDLHLSPGTFGVLLSLAGGGALLAAAASSRASRWRPGVALISTALLTGGCIVALPLAKVLPPLVVLPVLLVVETAGATLGNVIQVTLRQSRTPARLQGRMNALFRVVYWGAWPLANLLGGLLAAATGAATAILAGGAVCVVSGVIAAVTPLRTATRD